MLALLASAVRRPGVARPNDRSASAGGLGTPAPGQHPPPPPCRPRRGPGPQVGGAMMPGPPAPPAVPPVHRPCRRHIRPSWPGRTGLTRWYRSRIRFGPRLRPRLRCRSPPVGALGAVPVPGPGLRRLDPRHSSSWDHGVHRQQSPDPERPGLPRCRPPVCQVLLPYIGHPAISILLPSTTLIYIIQSHLPVHPSPPVPAA